MHQKTIVTCLIGGFPLALVFAWISHKASATKDNHSDALAESGRFPVGAESTFGPALVSLLAVLVVLAVGVAYLLRSPSPAVPLVVDGPPGVHDLLPLRHGRYSSSTCVDPANAALLFYDGKSLNGVHSAACKATVS
jgi:hypothetical protein